MSHDRKNSPVVTLDPAGELYPLPTYPWRGAPTGYATRRQLAADGLRPNGQPPVAQIIRHRRGRAGRVRGPLVGYLYRVELAAPKRPVTPAMLAAVRTAVRARMVCVGGCGKRLDYIPPLFTGRRCFECADGNGPAMSAGNGPAMSAGNGPGNQSPNVTGAPAGQMRDDGRTPTGYPEGRQ